MLTVAPEWAADGQPYRTITLRNSAGMVVSLMDWGATLLSCRVPMKDGSVRETALGCATPQDYLRQTAYLGASIGRYANRIAASRYTDRGQIIKLVANQECHQLHGGPQGFDKRRWLIANQNDSEVIFTLQSASGDQGFPGLAQITAHYLLDEHNALTIRYSATVDEACPINLTNHTYFNLEREHGDARDHLLQIAADHYLPVNAEGIPDRKLEAVAGTGFDFTRLKAIRRDFLTDADQQCVQGYDHAFLLNHGGSMVEPAAQLWAADRRLQLTLYTTAPALQFYSGNHLTGTPARKEKNYDNWQGIALESEWLPDSPNHPEWPQPSAVIEPGQCYQNVTRWQFTAH